MKLTHLEIREQLKSFHGQLNKKIESTWEGKSKLSPSELTEVQDLYLGRALVLFGLESYAFCFLDVLACLDSDIITLGKEPMIRLMFLSLHRIDVVSILKHCTSKLHPMLMMYDSARKDYFYHFICHLARFSKQSCGGTALISWDDLFWYRNEPVDPPMFDGTKLVKDPAAGRKVVATRRFNTGDLLKPYNEPLLCISDRYENVCDHCLKELGSRNSPVIRCEKCHHPKYCSSECKLKAWNQYHSVSCGTSVQHAFTFAQTGISSSSNTEIFLLRMVCMAAKAKCDLLDLPILKILCSSSGRFMISFWAMMRHAKHLHNLGLLLNPKFDLWKLAVATHKQSVNSFGTVHKNELYGAASMFNHSCAPNATGTMRVLQKIKPGDEITIDYSQVGNDLIDANCMRYITYGFVCECPKCIKTRSHLKTWDFAFQQLELD